MPIKFRCHHCCQMLGISHTRAGAIVDCPGCGRSLRVPQADGMSDRPASAVTTSAVTGKNPATQQLDPELLDAIISLAELGSHAATPRPNQATSDSVHATLSQMENNKSPKDSFTERQSAVPPSSEQLDTTQTIRLQDVLRSLAFEDAAAAANSQQTTSGENRTEVSPANEDSCPEPGQSDLLSPAHTSIVESTKSDDALRSDGNQFINDPDRPAADPGQPVRTSTISPKESQQPLTPAVPRPAMIFKQGVGTGLAIGLVAGLLAGLLLSNSLKAVIVSLGSAGQQTNKSQKQTDSGNINRLPSAETNDHQFGDRQRRLISDEATFDSRISGRVTWLDINKAEQPDQNALLILLPMQNPGRLKLDGTSLRELSPNTEQSAVAAALKELGVHFVRADDQGAFSFSARKDVSYTLVAVSRHTAQDGDFQVAPEIEKSLSQFFQSSMAITGRLKSQAISVPAANDANRIIDVHF